MRKYLFSVICFIIAISITIYMLIAPFWVDMETFIYTASVICSFATSMLMTALGMANMPKKEKGQ